MLKKTIISVAAPATFVVLVALAVAVANDLPNSALLRDGAAVLEGPWYFGLFSTIGGVAWLAAGACACLLCGRRSHRRLLRAVAVSSPRLGYRRPLPRP